MQTIKIKYQTLSIEDKNLIGEYQKQYSSCLHYNYNRIKDNQLISEKDLRTNLSNIRNVNLINSYLMQCSIKEAIQINKTLGNKIIFGGKKNFFNRLKGNISKEEYQIKRLSPIYIIGEGAKSGNRFIQIKDSLDEILIKFNRQTHISIKLLNVRNRINILSKLYKAQLNKSLAITYKIDSEYIYISFDENKLFSVKLNNAPIENRIISIDLNPNYIGYSIIDWKSSSDFQIIKSGVYSIKHLNDLDFNLKGKGFNSSSDERIYLSNKRQHEILEISKNLINKAIYYRCSIFSMEDLSIKSSDKENGKHFNKLVNNLWCRNILVNNLTKRCNIFKIKLLKVKPEYSSFIGNFLFRHLNLPDMILSSIEISRRAYEFYNQYVIKSKNIKKNIIQPNISDFKDLMIKSLEEFNINEKFDSLVDLYYFFKKSKLMYRLSLDQFKDLKFFRLNSIKSNISVCYF